MGELERCFNCDDATGRAGAYDDSIYAPDGTGPFCETCWNDYGCKSCDGEGQTQVWRDYKGKVDYLSGKPTGEMTECDSCKGAGWHGIGEP